MPRPVQPRPLGEYLSVLARLMRQVEADRKLSGARATRVKSALATAMQEIQDQLSGR